MRSSQKLGENCELETPPAQNPEQESGECVLRRRRGRRPEGMHRVGAMVRTKSLREKREEHECKV